MQSTLKRYMSKKRADVPLPAYPADLAWSQAGAAFQSSPSPEQNAPKPETADPEVAQEWPEAIVPDPTPALGGPNDFLYRLCVHLLPFSTAILTRLYPRCQESPSRLDIKIGTGPSTKRYMIHAPLICHYSSYFSGACSSGFAESISKKFDLTLDDPIAFRHFVHWMYAWDKTIPVYSPASSVSGWSLESAESAWMLADKLLAPEFGKFALAQFVRFVHLMSAKRLAVVYTQTSRDSALRLFCSRWIAFCRQGKGNDVSKVLQREEYEEMNISIQGSSDDPRRYQVEHWYSACGKEMDPSCVHAANEPGANWPAMRMPWNSWVRLRGMVWNAVLVGAFFLYSICCYYFISIFIY